MKIGWRTFIVASALVLVVTIPIFASVYRTEKQILTGIVVETPTVKIGVYWDEECTQPATVIDFGKVIQPDDSYSLSSPWIYLKNEGTVSIPIYWNSTLSLATDEIVQEGWYDRTVGRNVALNGTTITPDQTLRTQYEITLVPYITARTYNWTLTIWGEY